MITPLMLLLSSTRADGTFDKPVDTVYLNKNDRKVILDEVHRMGRMICRGDDYWVTEEINGKQCMDVCQAVDTKMVDISMATAVMLDRIKESYEVFCKYDTPVGSEEDTDFGLDNLLLQVEGNPRYIYVYVYNVMSSRGSTYNAKMAKLKELYDIISVGSTESSGDDQSDPLTARLEEQSYYEFWQRVLMRDIMVRTGAPAVVSKEDIDRVKVELKQLGFYGFVNPYEMYKEFLGSRINRKSEIEVSEDTVEFLRQIITSGGVSV